MKGIKDFNKKLVYIFGGSTGIGLALAKEFAANGADIIIFARTKSKLLKAVMEIENCRKHETLVDFREVDVAESESVNSAIDHCCKNYGAPDILINCAGRAYPRYFKNITFEQFDDTMKVNLYGIWNTCSAAVPYMESKGGLILNTSSVVGFIGVFGYTDYAASKFAIMGFSEALRNELKSNNIGVSVLCPPDTDTPGFETENKTKPIETKAISESAKIMTPEEVAKECIAAIKKGKKVIIPGFDGKLSYVMKRITPSIVDWVMDSSIKKFTKKYNHSGATL